MKLFVLEIGSTAIIAKTIAAFPWFSFTLRDVTSGQTRAVVVMHRGAL